MLQRLEQIDKDVSAGERVKNDATYTTYLEEQYKTTEKLVNLELKYSQEAILWSNEWVSEKENEALYLKNSDLQVTPLSNLL